MCVCNKVFTACQYYFLIFWVDFNLMEIYYYVCYLFSLEDFVFIVGLIFLTMKSLKSFHINLAILFTKQSIIHFLSNTLLYKFIKSKINKGFKIKKINCFAVNSFESEILEKLGFIKVNNITNECFLYEKNIF